jgi:hypothetical protein
MASPMAEPASPKDRLNPMIILATSGAQVSGAGIVSAAAGQTHPSVTTIAVKRPKAHFPFPLMVFHLQF